MSKIYNLFGVALDDTKHDDEAIPEQPLFWDKPASFDVDESEVSFDIFCRKELLEKNDLRSQYQLLGQLSHLLAVALIICENDHKAAWELVQMASKIGHPLDSPYFNALYGVVAPEVARSMHCVAK